MKLELDIPGLLAAPARLAAQLDVPDAAALRDWCRRSRDTSAASGRDGYIRHALAMQHAPLAALAWLGATGEKPAAPVLFATPVHLAAGLHDLVLFAGPAIGATDAERARLAHDIAEAFGDSPMIRLAGRDLFLQVSHDLDLETTALHDAQGHAVRENLPRGRDARKVHAWMNELQMFLHDHSLNRDRAARGLPALNGLWFWGEGDLPDVPPRQVTVFARTLPMRGLGLLLGDARDHRELGGMLPSSGHHVIEIPDCADALDADDAAAWRDAVQRVSREILQPVIRWFDAHRNAEAILHAGDGRARTLRGGPAWLQRVFRREPALRVTAE